MHSKIFFTSLAIFCNSIQLNCTREERLLIRTPNMPHTERSRPEPLPLHTQQEDTHTIEKIINSIHLNIYPRQACKDALSFAFHKIRENPTLENLTPDKEQKLNPLILVKEMWKLYSSISEPDDRYLATYYDTDSRTIQRMRSESARNLVYAAINLKSEDTIYKLHRQRLILASSTGIFAVLTIFSSLATYYGFCHT
jgi:hypothetical protein